jgi:two-component system chemotaxis sensor kinase CheA
MTELDDEIVQEFLVESHENLDQLDRDLVALEREPASRELLGSVFRTIHTIKGTSGFLALHQLESVSHVGENLLSRLRDGVLTLDTERAAALLDLVDAVRAILGCLETTGAEGTHDLAELTARLASLLEPDATGAAAPVSAVAAAAAVAAAVVAAPGAATEAASPASAAPPEAALPIQPEHELLGEILLEHGTVSPSSVEAALLEQQVAGDERPIGEILVDHGAVSEKQVSEALETQSEGRRSVADSTIRVDVDLLDALMRQVGELVLTRNQVVSQAATLRDTNLLRAAQRLNLIASELQEGVMKTRMQPIGNVWAKLPRIVRDLGVACNRQVRLEMEGAETELDKTLLEAVKDPLTHLVRNAVDHGIETAEDRLAAGKPAEGVLTLRAFHESGQVNIEIRDDGQGIDPARVGAKALERGLVTRDQLAVMSTPEIVNMIFLPGFSTAAAVTNVSGRGVGMDVVRTNIEKIGGTVDVASVPGRGSTIRIKIPLTLAIIPAVTFQCAGERYAIPQVALVELVSLDAEEAQKGIEWVSEAPVYRLRGRLLPLVYLDAVLGLSAEDGTRQPRESLSLVVLQADGRQFGLVVDRVLDSEEIVVKPLGRQLKGIGIYSGATITGDGAVALILDVLNVGLQSGVLSASRDRAFTDASVVAAVEERESLLLVGVGEDRRMSIPLGMVTRLEEFAVSAIERVGSREVVQYRGQILPLVRLASHLGNYSDPDRERVQVVVHAEGGRSVGLLVEAIHDITEESVTGRSDLDSTGLLGSAIVDNRVTEMLDVRSAVLAADPNFFRNAPVEQPAFEMSGAYS